MHTSYYWIGYFQANARHNRIDWTVEPSITGDEMATVLPLGETSEGEHLIAASTKYAFRISDRTMLMQLNCLLKKKKSTATTWAIILIRLDNNG
jgi:hypothetical protein